MYVSDAAEIVPTFYQTMTLSSGHPFMTVPQPIITHSEELHTTLLILAMDSRILLTFSKTLI